MKEIRVMTIGELAAFACTHLHKNGIDAVLSGGGCVAVHTDGKYVSHDLDFTENHSSSRRKLQEFLP